MPGGSAVLRAGDRLTVLGDPDGIRQLETAYRWRPTVCGSAAQGSDREGRTRRKQRQRTDEPRTLEPWVGLQPRVMCRDV